MAAANSAADRSLILVIQFLHSVWKANSDWLLFQIGDAQTVTIKILFRRGGNDASTFSSRVARKRRLTRRHRQCDGQQETARRRSLIRKESFPSDVNLDGKIGAYPIRLPSLQSLRLKFPESWIFTD